MPDDVEKKDSGQSVELHEFAREFINLQKQELEVRQQEIQANSRDLDNQKEIALAAIKAQKEDRQDSRETYQAESTKRKVFILLFVFLVVLVPPPVLVWLGQTAFAEEYLKYILAIGFSAFGGYGFAIKAMRDQD